MEIREGTAGDLILQWVKRAAFRWPVLRDFSRPRYSYNIYPSQLSWLCHAITATRDNSGGCIVEVGCARGMTTAFLLAHMEDRPGFPTPIGVLRSWEHVPPYEDLINNQIAELQFAIAGQ